MIKIKPSRVVWAYIPGNLCNLNCSYCYVRGKGKEEKFLYSIDHMLECFNPKRFGGKIFFGGASSGETFLCEGLIDFTEGMLSHGHIVSYTTNTTITPIVEKFCNFSTNLRSRLEIDASLHYLELKRKKLLDTYFENLHMLKSSGISIAIFLVISDVYLPYLREISRRCQKEAGILPIAGMLREYSPKGAIPHRYTKEEDKLVRETCDTRQWELQKRIYGYKRNEFCHAGEYSINMSLRTGQYTKCWGHSGRRDLWIPKRFPKLRYIYNNQVMGNIFKDPDAPIKFEPIKKCPFYDCICASYLCWGLVPSLNVETHSKTYFTKKSVSKEVWDFMDSKIGE